MSVNAMFKELKGTIGVGVLTKKMCLRTASVFGDGLGQGGSVVKI